MWQNKRPLLEKCLGNSSIVLIIVESLERGLAILSFFMATDDYLLARSVTEGYQESKPLIPWHEFQY